MDTIQTLLDQLEDKRLDYVMARSRVSSDRQAYLDAGISRQTFYGWPTEERERLNDIAQQLKRAGAVRALMILHDAAEEAAQVKVEGLRSRNERVKQDVATEILDRNLGKPNQPVSQDISGEVSIGITPVDYRTAIASIATGSEQDSLTSGQDQGTGDGPEMG
jgi:hypothetical protein